MSTRKNLTVFVAAAACAMSLVCTAAHSQTTANGPYYATPSWDQKLQCDSLSTCPRFLVLANWNNEAVLDRETGLVWQRVPRTVAANMTYADAALACAGETTGGRRGWRMPTVEELSSLFDPGNPASPYLPFGHPFTVPSGFSYFSYWTSTLAADAYGPNARITVDDVPVPSGPGRRRLALGLAAPPSAGATTWCARAPSSPS